MHNTEQGPVGLHKPWGTHLVQHISDIEISLPCTFTTCYIRILEIDLVCNGSVTWGGLSGLDLQEARKMSKRLGKIKIRLFLGQVLYLSEE